MSKLDDETAVIIAAVMSMRDHPPLSDETLRQKEEELLARTKTSHFVIGVLVSVIYTVACFCLGFILLANGDMISVCLAILFFALGIYLTCRKPVRNSIQIIQERRNRK